MPASERPGPSPSLGLVPLSLLFQRAGAAAPSPVFTSSVQLSLGKACAGASSVVFQEGSSASCVCF